MTEIRKLVDRVLSGDRRSIAKAITIVEDNSKESQQLITLLYPHTGKAHIVGLTGPAGAGKSTLADQIVHEYRRKGKKVGVVAVDPSSPFTGGAFLGDRIRMQELTTDHDVFIRSMATRNYPGGIAKATKDSVAVMDAAGKEIIVVETAGAGQSEVEIIKVAQTIVVIHAPGLGDEIQAIKAGMMEIADIFVVNKADRENANKTMMDIQATLQLDNKAKPWRPQVLKTIALTGEGVPELVEKIEEHCTFLNQQPQFARSRERVEIELTDALREKIVDSVLQDLKQQRSFEELVQNISERKIDPYAAAEQLLRKVLRNAET